MWLLCINQQLIKFLRREKWQLTWFDQYIYIYTHTHINYVCFKLWQRTLQIHIIEKENTDGW
jgi:hypothetical protein